MTANKIFVSVIIPAYNQARFLGDALESVLSQTYPYYEIIVVDDGSTDNTSEVIHKYGSLIKSIQQENMGLGGARNTGIRNSRGEFIGFLDADDIWLPDYLEKMIGLAGNFPDAGVYYCGAKSIDQYGGELFQYFGKPFLLSSTIYHILIRHNFLIPSTILLRRSVIDEIGLFEQSNPLIHGCEDWDLWLRIAPKYRFIGTSEILVHYRLHGSSLSANPTKMQRAVRAVIEKNFGPENGDPAEWSKEKRRAYGGVYRFNLISSIQRQNDWEVGVSYLQKALFTDPTLAEDLDLFYDLALGSQPLGLRGTSQQLALEENAISLLTLLRKVFNSSTNIELQVLQSTTFGTAYFALSLVAYNTGKRSLSRVYLIKALRYRPELWRDARVKGNFIKSFISSSIRNKLKHKFSPL